jgi:hypothetical protein
MLTPKTRAIDFGISPRAIVVVTWNNYENLEDGSFGRKHFSRCSYTIPKNPPKDKWGTMAKAWENKILFKIKICLS